MKTTRTTRRTTTRQETTPAAPAGAAVLGEPKPEPGAAREAEVRRRAFEIYIERQRTGGRGDALSDWARAEREVGAAA